MRFTRSLSGMHLTTLAILSLVALSLIPSGWSWGTPDPRVIAQEAEPSTLKDQVGHRSPVDVAISSDEKWLVTANETSDSVSLIERASGAVVDEFLCGAAPAKIQFLPKQNSFLVSCSQSNEILLLDIVDPKIRLSRKWNVGSEPTGLTISPDADRAYVALPSTGEVALISLQGGTDESTVAVPTKKIRVGNWPRYLTLSPDGSRLAVGCSGDGKVFVVDTTVMEVLYDEVLNGGINLGHMQSSGDGKYVYFPWMIYRTNPINPGNIRQGWVLASRIGRIRLDGAAYREAISLDVPGMAVADPHGLVITANQERMIVAASGTHELLVYRLKDLPFVGVGGPGDLIDRALMRDNDLFYRIELRGRPMGVTVSSDNRTAYVANYSRDSVQVVDIQSKEIVQELSLGQRPELSLARKGMEIFYDGRRSLDQWYSCHSCHYNGGINSRPIDTNNDGSTLTFKTVLPLYLVHDTAPWTWHGWQTDIEDAMQKSFVQTMQGERASKEDVEAILVYLATLQPPKSPYLNADGTLSEKALRGKAVFEGSVAGCATCHNGKNFTDGQVHEVGLTSEKDKYQGYNTPTLRGLFQKVRYLHDGRSKTLEALLTGPHSPEKVTANGSLSAEELSDLIEYLKTL